MILILIFVIAPIVISFVLAFTLRSDHGYATIDFESFKKFYNINPDRWELHDEYVCCATKIEYDMIWKSENFQFNYLDYQKYKKWLKNKQEYDKKLKHAKSTAEMIAVVKQDIEKLEKMSDAEINKAKSIIEILFEV